MSDFLGPLSAGCFGGSEPARTLWAEERRRESRAEWIDRVLVLRDARALRTAVELRAASLRAIQIGVCTLALSGCIYDTSTVVNVAPSAQAKLGEIRVAVTRLNQQIGDETYIVQSVDSEARIDGEMIVRCTDALEKHAAHETRVGNTHKTRAGVVVTIAENASACAIAHEFGHAAGLEHVSDETNLMYRVTAPTRWHLNSAQLDQLRESF